MRKILLSLIVFTSVSLNAATISETLLGEWQRFRAHIETLTPDGDVGGYLNYKEYGDMTLLWKLSDDPSDHQTIRFFMDRPGVKSFAVTYHRTPYIIDGHTILRRFMGGEPTGWINHTIDVETGDYFGSQGYYVTPEPHELEMIRQWQIEILK